MDTLTLLQHCAALTNSVRLPAHGKPVGWWGASVPPGPPRCHLPGLAGEPGQVAAGGRGVGQVGLVGGAGTIVATSEK